MATTREIINISLPPQMAKEVRREAKSGGYSVSEYIRHVLREQKTKVLANELNADKALFDAGKGKKLQSLRDLR